jgi:lycopene cyclase domain-containing protein
LNPKYLYLSLNLFSFLIPFLLSFHPRVRFWKKWRYAIPSILITALFFVVWDELFTRLGVWGFNPKYLSGIYLFSLPIEEVMFFFCIPYACVFTYFTLKSLVERDYLFPHHELISSVLIVAMLVAGGYYINQSYTGTTFLLTGLFLAFQMLKLRPRYMGRFYFAFIFILVPFFIVNGILTGTFIDEPVVWYNDHENLGLRLGTIPVEDIFYGMLLILLSVSLTEEMELRLSNK